MKKFVISSKDIKIRKVAKALKPTQVHKSVKGKGAYVRKKKVEDEI